MISLKWFLVSLLLCGIAILQSKVSAEDQRKEVIRHNGINANTVNPSVLIHPRENDPRCTYDLYRVPKTGSTALFNAVMLDNALHRRVCWNNAHDWHKPPTENTSHAIIVGLRHPESLALSHMRYEGYWKKANNTIDPHKWLAAKSKRRGGGVVSFTPSIRPPTDGRAHLLTPYVLERTGKDDIYLCIGNGYPALDTQLRVRFADESIHNIPLENVNHRREGIHFTTQDLPLLLYWLRWDLVAWRKHCSKADLDPFLVTDRALMESHTV